MRVRACAPVHKACIINTVFASLRLRVLHATGHAWWGGGSGRFQIDPSALSAVPARREEVALHLDILGRRSMLDLYPSIFSHLNYVLFLLLSHLSSYSNMQIYFRLRYLLFIPTRFDQECDKLVFLSIHLEGSLKSLS